MNKKFINFYFVAAIITYIFAIALFVKNTVNEYSAGAQRCVTLSDKYIKSFSEKTLSQAVRELENSNDIAAFSVKQNGKMIALKNESFNFEETTRFIQAITTPVSKGESPIIVSIAVYKLNPAAIFINAKKSFFIILGCTLVTIILIILEPLFNKEKNKKQDSDSSNEADAENALEEENSETSPDGEINLENNAETMPANTESGLNPAENNKLAETPDNEEADTVAVEEDSVYTEDTGSFGETGDLNGKENTSAPAEDSSVQENNDSIQTEQTENTSVKEDFDIDIFPKEEKIEIQTLDDIENPLNKKLSELLADNNKEISLFLLCYSGTNSDELITENIKSFITDSYFTEDMIFSYNNRTLALIKPDTDIDAAEDFAADFHNALTEQVRSEKSEISFNIGISSRATRSITAERLVTEANEALKHALEDEESHIIGFHVDIEKYNEFMRAKE